MPRDPLTIALRALDKAMHQALAAAKEQKLYGIEERLTQANEILSEDLVKATIYG